MADRVTKFRVGQRVRVLPVKPNGEPHPQAGKTGTVIELMGVYTSLFSPTAQVRVDKGIEPQGVIVVGLGSLETIEEPTNE